MSTPTSDEQALTEQIGDHTVTPTAPTPYTPTDEDMLVVIEDRLHDAMLTACKQEPDGEMTTYVDAPMMEVLRIVEDALAARDARVRAEAIAPVLALHRAMPLYDLATECKTPDDEDHADAHHSESDDGELLCMDSPAGTVCEHCRDTDGSLVDHPCETFAAASIEQETQP